MTWADLHLQVSVINKVTVDFLNKIAVVCLVVTTCDTLLIEPAGGTVITGFSIGYYSERQETVCLTHYQFIKIKKTMPQCNLKQMYSNAAGNVIAFLKNIFTYYLDN